MKEIWRSVPGYEGLYEVSDQGNVASLNYNRTGMRQLMKPNIDSKGYLVVVLWKDGKMKYRKVHQLVAMAFLEHVPNGYEVVVDHINFDPADNRLDNLQLLSSRQNSARRKYPGISKYQGVYWNKHTLAWRSQIMIGEKKYHLGYFASEEVAAYAYKKALERIAEGLHPRLPNYRDFRHLQMSQKKC